jgi:hypothetical protein
LAEIPTLTKNARKAAKKVPEEQQSSFKTLLNNFYQDDKNEAITKVHIASLIKSNEPVTETVEEIPPKSKVDWKQKLVLVSGLLEDQIGQQSVKSLLNSDTSDISQKETEERLAELGFLLPILIEPNPEFEQELVGHLAELQHSGREAPYIGDRRHTSVLAVGSEEPASLISSRRDAKALYASVTVIGGEKVKVMLDSGCIPQACISEKEFRRIRRKNPDLPLKKTSISVSAACSTKMRVIGSTNLILQFEGGVTVLGKFFVVTHLAIPYILGLGWLRKAHAIIDFSERKPTLCFRQSRKKKVVQLEYGVSHARALLITSINTLFQQHTENTPTTLTQKPILLPSKEEKKTEKHAHRSEKRLVEEETPNPTEERNKTVGWWVFIKTFMLALLVAGCGGFIGSSTSPETFHTNSEPTAEDAPIFSLGEFSNPLGQIEPQPMWLSKTSRSRKILRAREHTRVEVTPPAHLPPGKYLLEPNLPVGELFPDLMWPRATVELRRNSRDRFFIPVTNLSHTHTSIPDRLQLYVASADFSIEEPHDHSHGEAEAPSVEEVWDSLEMDENRTAISEGTKRKFKRLVRKHIGVFAKHPKAPPESYVAPHKIPVIPGTKPISQRPYQESLPRREQIRKHVRTMLDGNIIRPSKSPWSAPVVLVNKPGEPKGRFCVDYRKLNAVSIPDRFPLPRIDDILSSLQGNSVFSTLDLSSGYWQIPVEEKDREKTAFICSEGLFEYNRMPFGLTNAPATFQRAIQAALAGLNYIQLCCYLDDVILFSKTEEEHLELIEQVFRRLKEAGMTLKASKCKFFSDKVEYLGHVVSPEGIRPTEKNVAAVRNFPTPKNVKGVQSFLGLVNYYR